MKKKNIINILFVVGIILLIPLFGNFFIDGWDWGVIDFIVIGLMLFITGLIIDLAARKIKNPAYRAIVIIGIVIVFLLGWVELAVDAVSRTIESIF